MKSSQIFKNEEFGQVKVFLVDHNPWFMGKEISAILGYRNTRDALLKHVDVEDKNTVAIHDGIGNPNKVIINESGLYSLILSSKLPQAKKFKRWVTSEVLPAIRKNGNYSIKDKVTISPQIHQYVYEGIPVIHSFDMGVAISVSYSTLLSEAKYLKQTIYMLKGMPLIKFKRENNIHGRSSSSMALFPKQTALALLEHRGIADECQAIIENYFSVPAIPLLHHVRHCLPHRFRNPMW